MEEWMDLDYLDGPEEIAPLTTPAADKAANGPPQVSFAALLALGVGYTLISDLRGPSINLGLIRFNLANIFAIWLAWAIAQGLALWGTDIMTRAGFALPGQAALLKAL